jgi:hypothetical protein
VLSALVKGAQALAGLGLFVCAPSRLRVLSLTTVGPVDLPESLSMGPVLGARGVDVPRPALGLAPACRPASQFGARPPSLLHPPRRGAGPRGWLASARRVSALPGGCSPHEPPRSGSRFPCPPPVSPAGFHSIPRRPSSLPPLPGRPVLTPRTLPFSGFRPLGLAPSAQLSVYPMLIVFTASDRLLETL